MTDRFFPRASGRNVNTWYGSADRTIWIVDARTSSRGGLRTPAGPHLLLRDEPAVGETIVGRIYARASRTSEQTADGDPTPEYAVRWSIDLGVLVPRPGDRAEHKTLRIWSTTAHARGLGDDSDPHEPADVTEAWLAEILSSAGDWDAASCEVRLDDSEPQVYVDRIAP